MIRTDRELRDALHNARTRLWHIQTSGPFLRGQTKFNGEEMRLYYVVQTLEWALGDREQWPGMEVHCDGMER